MDREALLAQALKAAKKEILWWVEEHRCCAGKEKATLAKIEAALSSTPDPAAESEESEVQRLRDLVATCYAGLGAECDLPEQWLDVLNAAANGEPFSTEGLLPYTREKQVAQTGAGVPYTISPNGVASAKASDVLRTDNAQLELSAVARIRVAQAASPITEKGEGNG